MSHVFLDHNHLSSDRRHLHLIKLTEQRASSPVNPPVHETVKGLFASPEAYKGDPEACEGFIVQSELFLGYQPRLSDQKKVSFVISRLTGKVKAMWLLPHRDWDCPITLKEGAVPPLCSIYPLSQDEEQAMEQYIKEALQQGYAQPSTSPASAGVFFMKKRDGA
uniref:Uncharacterized protein n=1 Tax=Electrophorus electricus TaxID=8005 RepID=A0AAY5EIX7_ELEEL